MAISDIVATVTPIGCYKERNHICSASGFFYNVEDSLHLVTNRHVFIDESEAYSPDEIVLTLHTDPNDIRHNSTIHLPLYDRDNQPLWKEHPRGGTNVDVVALPLRRDDFIPRFFMKAFAPNNHIPADAEISIGEDVHVIGYPLGFHDRIHNLPIVRSAIIASVYPVPFEGQPFVLIDSRLHSGTSGSPVLTKPTNILRRNDGSTSIMTGTVTYLVGVHSASVDLSDRDPDEDEPLGLNVVWFAALIPEIIRGPTAA